ncbi:MAG: transcriptional regulator [Parabacteroides sp.]|nr:transcriptional regulator [Parabacteroides sp.]
MNRLLLFISVVLFVSLRASANILDIFVKNYSVEDYRASCQNRGLSLTSDGILCVANTAGLLVFDGNTWKLYSLPDKLPAIGVAYDRGIVYTQSERGIAAWIKDKAGILHCRPLKKLPAAVHFTEPPVSLPFILPEEVQNARPTSFAANRFYYFVGTYTDGLFILDQKGQIVEHLSTKNQLIDNIVHAVNVQNESQVWLALDNGLSRITFQSTIVMLGGRSSIGKLMNGGTDGNKVYIQTNHGYFKRDIKNSRLLSVSEKEAIPYMKPLRNENHLPLSRIFTNANQLGLFSAAEHVYPAGDNLYWLTLENEIGLFQLSGGKGTLKCRLLLDDYNMNLVTNGPQIIQLNDTLTLVSVMQGAAMLNIRSLLNSNSSGRIPLKVYGLEFVDASGTHEISLDTKEISLPHDFQEFRVFVGTSVFTINHLISYKIEGVSSGWSAWQQSGKISFLQLPEGDYELKVRKYVSRGPFLELTLPISVRPPWYNTIWAWICYIGLIWLVSHCILKYNLHNLHKEEQQKKKIEEQNEQQQMQVMKSRMLEQELQNKNSELTLQTTALLKRNESIQALINELDKQKEALGERYPNKLYVRLKSMMEETLDAKADWKLFESYFNAAHQNFVERLRSQYTDITPGDLRICCLLKMNLSTKEIASLLNISIRAVELRRYRLRKRLMLEGDTNLTDFLIRF